MSIRPNVDMSNLRNRTGVLTVPVLSLIVMLQAHMKETRKCITKPPNLRNRTGVLTVPVLPLIVMLQVTMKETRKWITKLPMKANYLCGFVIGRPLGQGLTLIK